MNEPEEIDPIAAKWFPSMVKPQDTPPPGASLADRMYPTMRQFNQPEPTPGQVALSADKAPGKVGGAAQPTPEVPAASQQAAAVPERYEITPPEGLALDEAGMNQFTPLARKHGLSQEAAQDLVNLYASHMQGALSGQIQTWEKAVRADQEIGGQNLSTSLEGAKRVLSRYGTPELTAALDQTGMGSHPELVRLLARVGKAINQR